MHFNNIHSTDYDFEGLITAYPELYKYVFTNIHNTQTIDFAKPNAVLALNTAILKHHYGLTHWEVPQGYLCPPIPGRADYIHHISDILEKEGYTKEIIGLDIGIGANCIYPILGSRIYDWKIVGADIDVQAVTAAKEIIKANKGLEERIEIRHQPNPAHIFEGIVQLNEYYHFTLCNPPFYASEKEAQQATKSKQKNLLMVSDGKRNFGGQANELWCNGGEALFLKRMIKESVNFKSQVGVFTSLVSKGENLPKLEKQLKKLNATYYAVKMEQGNKKSRILVWKF